MSNKELRSVISVSVLLTFVVLATAPALHAQAVSNATVTGRVIDEQGAIVAGAQIKMTGVETGTVSTNVFLRRVHNFALDMGWLPWPVIPKKHWPKVRFREKRAITPEEHQAILDHEPNPDRKAFYQLCWLARHREILPDASTCLNRFHLDLFWSPWTGFCYPPPQLAFARFFRAAGAAFRAWRLYARTMAIGRRDCGAPGRQSGYHLQMDHPQENARPQAWTAVEVPRLRS